jgi:hypothetical protein
MKKVLVVFVLLIIAMLVVTIRSKDVEQGIDRPMSVSTSSSQTPDSHSHMDYAAKGRVPAYYETPPPSLPNTLSPELFTGNKRLAYQAAKEIPQTLAQLPCYCHCDRGPGHKSLHSCFESEHGENCGICIGEALMAHSLKKRGVSVTEIRKQIIAAYGEAQ